MSQDNDDKPDGSKQVLDEEGDVDAAVKQRILNSREAINENENVLYTQRAVDPEIRISEAQATVAWGHSVRRYIRDVEILLTSDDIPGSKEYYKGIKLGKVTLEPPAVRGYNFSLFARDDDDMLLKKRMGLPHDCEPPKPYTKKFTGLKSLLDGDDMVYHSWSVTVDKSGPREDWERLTLENQKPIPKKIYDRAVRHTDQFLQNAGIGMKTGLPEVDDEGEPW